MARYHIHLEYEEATLEDEEGAEFSSPEAAVAEARLSAIDILAGDIRAQRNTTIVRVHVLDRNGCTVAFINAKDLIPAALRQP